MFLDAAPEKQPQRSSNDNQSQSETELLLKVAGLPDKGRAIQECVKEQSQECADSNAEDSQTDQPYYVEECAPDTADFRSS